MSRNEHFNTGAWSFPVSPDTVVDRTRAGGFTVDLNTGTIPKTGTMVSIPGHEHPVPIEKFGGADVSNYVTPERKEVLKAPEMHLGTWRSDSDKKIGDAAYLDVSKRHPDTPEGASAARGLAMKGSQWALYNIDRDMFESNITKPEVVQDIKETKKVEIPQEEIKKYSTSTEPVGQHLALGYRTEPDVIRTKSGRKKTIAAPGQMTFVELGTKAN